MQPDARSGVSAVHTVPGASSSPTAAQAVDVTPDLLRARTARFASDVISQISDSLNDRCNRLGATFASELKLGDDALVRDAVATGIKQSILTALQRAIGPFAADPLTVSPPNADTLRAQFDRVRYIAIQVKDGTVQIPTKVTDDMSPALRAAVEQLGRTGASAITQFTSETRMFRDARGTEGTFRPRASSQFGTTESLVHWNVDEHCCGGIHISAHLSNAKMSITLNRNNGTELQRYQIVRSIQEATNQRTPVSPIVLERILVSAQKIGATIESSVAPVCTPRSQIGNWVVSAESPERSQFCLGEIHATAVSTDGRFQISLFRAPNERPSITVRPRDPVTGEVTPEIRLRLTGSQSGVNSFRELQEDFPRLLAQLELKQGDKRADIAPQSAEAIKNGRFQITRMDALRTEHEGVVPVRISNPERDAANLARVGVRSGSTLVLQEGRSTDSASELPNASIVHLHVEPEGRVTVERLSRITFSNCRIDGTLEGPSGALSDAVFERCSIAPSPTLKRVLFGILGNPNELADRFVGCRPQETFLGVDLAHFKAVPSPIRRLCVDTIKKLGGEKLFVMAVRPVYAGKFVTLADTDS